MSSIFPSTKYTLFSTLQHCPISASSMSM
ncbi:hypothetical protein WG66_012899, partial [Moniliophthora roreri]